MKENANLASPERTMSLLADAKLLCSSLVFRLLSAGPSKSSRVSALSSSESLPFLYKTRDHIIISEFHLAESTFKP